MDRMDFVQSVSIIKVKEKKLITKQKLIRMIDAYTSKEVMKALSETDYMHSMIGITNEEDFEYIIKNETNKTYNFIRELARKNQEIVDILAIKHEYQNLKLELKQTIQNVDLSDMMINTQMLNNIKIEKTRKEARDIYEKTKDVRAMSIFIDKMYFEHLNELSDKINLKLFRTYKEILIDNYNINTFLRLKQQKENILVAENLIVCGGSVLVSDILKIYERENYIDDLNAIFLNKKNIKDIEKYYENKIVELIREYRFVNYGPEPLFTYILAKEYEMKAIRLIMTGKINKLSASSIKEKMRDVYV